ncbi:hypothetical protein CAEBREN_20559 [Caenorhabditis brenneri]|uniref:Uncharacterized protein n=1 Tax=Caenorhabditis brenneri TaxID=135651 RepID=G0NHL4_CAEBE|nr:hypothetical protein CAEBREN_20559 [Caenorhabditis brenneri]
MAKKKGPKIVVFKQTKGNCPSQEELTPAPQDTHILPHASNREPHSSNRERRTSDRESKREGSSEDPEGSLPLSSSTMDTPEFGDLVTSQINLIQNTQNLMMERLNAQEDRMKVELAQRDNRMLLFEERVTNTFRAVQDEMRSMKVEQKKLRDDMLVEQKTLIDTIRDDQAQFMEKLTEMMRKEYPLGSPKGSSPPAASVELPRELSSPDAQHEYQSIPNATSTPWESPRKNTSSASVESPTGAHIYKLPSLGCFYTGPIYVLILDATIIGWTTTFKLLVEFLFIGILGILSFLIIRDQNKNINLSRKTLALQKKLFMSLIFQTGIPFAVIILPLSYFAYSVVFDNYSQAMNNVCFLIITNHGLLTTFAIMTIHKPYREAAFPCASKKRKTKNEIISIILPTIGGND